MKRRDLLAAVPAGWFGMNLFAGPAQGRPKQPVVSSDVVEFWVKRMGIDPESIPQGKTFAERKITSGLDPAVQREPAFFHVDNQEFALVAGDKVDQKLLAPSGDIKVEFRLRRLRLNAQDRETFRRYRSGGIYIDVGQNVQATPDMGSAVATSFFSALLPNLAGNKQTKSSKMAGANSPASTGSNTTSNKSGKSKSMAANSGGQAGTANGLGGGSGGSGAKADSAPPTAGGSVALQSPSQSQSLVLTKGAGSTAFSCFAKDQQKSIFGQLVSAMLSDQVTSLLPIFSLPVIGAPALAALRTLVGNLQAHGGDNQWILRSGPMDLVAAQDALSLTSPESLRIRSGNSQYYIVVPKGQVAGLADKLNGLRMYDGFLIPKDVKDEDAYAAADTTLPEITYLSMTTTTTSATKVNKTAG